MKKGVKATLCTGIIAGMVLASSMTAFAGTWKTGAGENQNKWWYDFDNGSYAANGWQWIDGNNDGVAECYYFDAAGWMLAGTTTPDGYIVNADGAWTENGVVKTQAVQAQVSTGDIDYSWLQSADGTVNYDVIYSAKNMVGWSADWMEMAKTVDPSTNWKQVFDRLQIDPNLGSELADGQSFKYVVTTPAGMTENDLQHAGAVVMARIMINVQVELENLTWNSSKDDNGVITVIVEGSTLPVDYADSWDDGGAAA